MTEHDHIEAYLAGTLPTAEAHAFAQRLAREPELQEEVAAHKVLAETLRDTGTHALRAQLHAVDAAWTAPPARQATRIRRRRASVWAIAASFVCLLVAGWVVWGTPDDAASLYAAYAAPYEVSLASRGTADAAVTVQAAEQAYFRGDYATAAEGFAQLQAEHDTPTFAFYYAVSSLLAQDAASAVPILQQLLAQDDHLYVEQARWYLGLAYLQLEDVKQAKAILGSLEATDFKAEAAKEVLMELE